MALMVDISITYARVNNGSRTNRYLTAGAPCSRLVFEAWDLERGVVYPRIAPNIQTGSRNGALINADER